MNSTTVRVSNNTKIKIKTISEEEGLSIQEIIDKAINLYENNLFLEKLNEAYAKSKNTVDELWDNTISDGLEEEEWDEKGNLIIKGKKNA